MTDEPQQLDLTASITDVPQANSLPLFIRLMEAVERGTETVAGLADHLQIEERTVHYYVDFARWLGMVVTRDVGHVDLTETGHTFADSLSARSRLFTQALFAKDLIQAANTIKRDSQTPDGVETLDSREACLKAIVAMAKLSQSTAERRASGLGHMLDAAYRANRIDWKTGEPLTEYRNITFDFPGRTFITALAGRQFGSRVEYRIGFPHQIRFFVEHHGVGLSTNTWKRSSFDSGDNQATWFGSLPVTETTQEIGARGGRDLRKLALMCAPYITLAVALLTYRDRLRRPSITITEDMYGIRLWDHDRELGAPLAVVEALAHELDLATVKGVPHKLRHAPADLVETGTDQDLLFLLRTLGFIKMGEDTTFKVSQGLDAEMREAREDSLSVVDRLAPVYEAIGRYLKSR